MYVCGEEKGMRVLRGKRKMKKEIRKAFIPSWRNQEDSI
jgi:hypothetical protein